jgi:hypothetical protein
MPTSPKRTSQKASKKKSSARKSRSSESNIPHIILPRIDILDSASHPIEKYNYRGCEAYAQSLMTNLRRFRRRLAKVNEILAMKLTEMQLDYYIQLKKRIENYLDVLARGIEEIISIIPTTRKPIKRIGTTMIPDMGSELLIDNDCGIAYGKILKELRRL